MFSVRSRVSFLQPDWVKRTKQQCHKSSSETPQLPTYDEPHAVPKIIRITGIPKEYTKKFIKKSFKIHGHIWHIDLIPTDKDQTARVIFRSAWAAGDARRFDRTPQLGAIVVERGKMDPSYVPVPPTRLQQFWQTVLERAS